MLSWFGLGVLLRATTSRTPPTHCPLSPCEMVLTGGTRNIRQQSPQCTVSLQVPQSSMHARRGTWARRCWVLRSLIHSLIHDHWFMHSAVSTELLLYAKILAKTVAIETHMRDMLCL